MKKYLSGLVILLMAISFSAFISGSADSRTSSAEAELYWYPVNSVTNEIDHTALINPSSPLTKSEMRTNNLVPCPEGSGPDCIRGFNNVQTSDHDSPGLESTQKVE